MNRQAENQCPKSAVLEHACPLEPLGKILFLFFCFFGGGGDFLNPSAQALPPDYPICRTEKKKDTDL